MFVRSSRRYEEFVDRFLAARPQLIPKGFLPNNGASAIIPQREISRLIVA